MTSTGPSIAIWYEHPTWFAPLFAELERRGVPHARLDAVSHAFDPREASAPYALAVNRASPSAHTRGNAAAIHHTKRWLHHLKHLGVPVVNGLRAFAFETSKASQINLLRQLGLPHPRTVPIHGPEQALRAAEVVGYPIVIKPNVGGSGAGIVRCDNEDKLQFALTQGAIAPAVDDVLLVQQYIEPADGRITRVEVLDCQFLYAINVYLGESFNLCPADICRSVNGRVLDRNACPSDAPDSGMRVEVTTVPDTVIAEVKDIARATGLDIGGIEFLVDAHTGRRVYYDINALSNFVAGARSLVGFDPVERFVDYLEVRLHAIREVA